MKLSASTARQSSLTARIQHSDFVQDASVASNAYTTVLSTYAGRIQRTGTDHYFVGLAPQGAFYHKKRPPAH